MPARNDLLGRAALVSEVTAALRAGRSVLLMGPEGIGKTAIIDAVGHTQAVIVDPFERISRQQAADIRRGLDHGAVFLGATRSTGKRGLGAVGRVLWRFSMIRVRELPPPTLAEIVRRETSLSVDKASDASWVDEIAALAAGRPGFAAAMARFAGAWQREHAYLPLPAFAYAATRVAARLPLVDA